MQVQDAEKWKLEEYALVSSLLAGKKSYTVPSGAELLGPEPSAGYLLYLHSGLAQVTYNDNRGAEVVMGHIFPGELCGEMGLFQNAQRGSNISVRAVGRCATYRISYIHFRQQAARNPQFIGLLMRQLAARMKRTTQRLTDMSLLGVQDRIASLLRELSEGPLSKTHPQGRQVRISRQNLARMVGCTRESAGRAVQQLQVEGFLRAKGMTMLIYHRIQSDKELPMKRRSAKVGGKK